jgi:hypothetical protein
MLPYLIPIIQVDMHVGNQEPLGVGVQAEDVSQRVGSLIYDFCNCVKLHWNGNEGTKE